MFSEQSLIYCKNNINKNEKIHIFLNEQRSRDAAAKK